MAAEKSPEYYVIEPDTDDDGIMMVLEYNEDHRDRSWHDGEIFTSDVSAPVWKQHPKVPIKLTIEEGYEQAPMSSFLEYPIPIMSKKLLDTVRAAGVTNIDSYIVEIYYPDGTLVPEDYYAFNLFGTVREGIAEEFLRSNTEGPLMFRLASDITTILIHKRIKEAIAEAEIEYIKTDPVYPRRKLP